MSKLPHLDGYRDRQTRRAVYWFTVWILAIFIFI